MDTPSKTMNQKQSKYSKIVNLNSQVLIGYSINSAQYPKIDCLTFQSSAK